MSWDGYNFEDAIIISERLVKDDTYTSIHIEEFDIEIRETKLGREEFTRDIPNVSREGAAEPRRERRSSGSAPSSSRATSWSARSRRSRKSELTPEEKLLHAIFGRAGEDVKNDSLEVPSGVEGIVIDTQRFSRRMSLTEDERKAFEKELKDTEQVESVKIADEFKQMIKALEEALGGPVLDPSTRQAPGPRQGPQGPGRRERAVQARGARPPQPRARGRGPQGRPPVRPADRGPPRREGPPAQQPEARRRAALRRARRWSRSTSPPSGSSPSATRWPAATATRASSPRSCPRRTCRSSRTARRSRSC